MISRERQLVEREGQLGQFRVPVDPHLSNNSAALHDLTLSCSELVRENRRLSKSIRELEHQLREETQRAHEKGLARGRYVRTLNFEMISCSSK